MTPDELRRVALDAAIQWDKRNEEASAKVRCDMIDTAYAQIKPNLPDLERRGDDLWLMGLKWDICSTGTGYYGLYRSDSTWSVYDIRTLGRYIQDTEAKRFQPAPSRSLLDWLFPLL